MARTYKRDARGRFASSGGSGGGASSRRSASKGGSSSRSGKTRTKPSPSTRGKVKTTKGTRNKPGASARATAGQAAWMKGFVGAAAARSRRGGAKLTAAQREKAQAAREKYGVHIGRKMAVRKASTLQMAKAELARRKYGKRSTAAKPGSSDRKSNRKPGERVQIERRSTRAARMASLRAVVAGESSGRAFSMGLRAAERVSGQKRIARKATRLIGKPARVR